MCIPRRFVFNLFATLLYHTILTIILVKFYSIDSISNTSIGLLACSFYFCLGWDCMHATQSRWDLNSEAPVYLVKSLVQILVHFYLLEAPFQKLEMKLATFRTKVIILSLSLSLSLSLVKLTMAIPSITINQGHHKNIEAGN